MVPFILCTIILANYFNGCFGQRRIVNGTQTLADKNYMIYLVAAQKAEVKYDAWICGGAIVSPSFLITSAACVENVQYMYAISGYRKYVNGHNIDGDSCSKNFKKKIVMTCVPKMYEFQYHDISKWLRIDIAVAMVDSPFDFNNANYIRQGCSYMPRAITINERAKYQSPGTDAFILGWGHREKWREVTETQDMNAPYLHDTTVLLVDNKVCKGNWPSNLHEMMDKYMICSHGAGMISSDGKYIVPNDNVVSECGPGRALSCASGESCECLPYYRRKSYNITKDEKEKLEKGELGIINIKEHWDNETDQVDHSFIAKVFNRTRRVATNGICQNDHGGPLVIWIGGQERLIGVQSAFLVDPNTKKCGGPYLYTSTYCNYAFIKCIIEKGNERLAECNKNPRKTGYTLVRRTISWEGHPDGPAKNEVDQQRSARSDNAKTETYSNVETTVIYNIRPQVPLYQ